VDRRALGKLQSDAHGRDHITHVELGLDGDGKFVALKVATIANMGAYLSTFAPCIPTYLYGTLLAGTYTTRRSTSRPRRCSPTPCRSMPIAAPDGPRRRSSWSALSISPPTSLASTGRIAPPQLHPGRTPSRTRRRWHCSTTAAITARPWTSRERRGLCRPSRTAGARRRGAASCADRIATYIEACGIAPSAVVGSLGARAGLFECAPGARPPDRQRHLIDRVAQPRQGHETTFAQLVADGSGFPMDSVESCTATPPRSPTAWNYGSRSLAVGGTAIIKAMDKIVAKGKKIAATCSKPPRPTSSSRTASSTVAAPTARRPSARWR